MGPPVIKMGITAAVSQRDVVNTELALCSELVNFCLVIPDSPEMRITVYHNVTHSWEQK